MTTRTVVASFESAGGARLAAEDLAGMGIERDAISVASEPDAFSGSLRGFLVPDADRHAYEESLHRGGALLTARVPEVRVDLVVRALEGAGAVDIPGRGDEGGATVQRAADEPSAAQGSPAVHYGRRELGRAGPVHVYYDPVDLEERTVGDPGSDTMGLNLSHPARHGGL